MKDREVVSVGLALMGDSGMFPQGKSEGVFDYCSRIRKEARKLIRKFGYSQAFEEAKKLGRANKKCSSCGSPDLGFVSCECCGFCDYREKLGCDYCKKDRPGAYAKCPELQPSDFRSF